MTFHANYLHEMSIPTFWGKIYISLLSAEFFHDASILSVKVIRALIHLVNFGHFNKGDNFGVVLHIKWQPLFLGENSVLVEETVLFERAVK